MAGSIETVVLNVPDISCAHCVSKVQKAVGELVGVSSVTASSSTKTATVAFDPNCVSTADIAARMKDAGYPVSDKAARLSTVPMVS
jgi:copper chaperone